MFAETARKIQEKLMKEGEFGAKQKILIRQLEMKYGLTADEKEQIRNVQKLWMLDVALDTVVTGEDKQALLAKLS